MLLLLNVVVEVIELPRQAEVGLRAILLLLLLPGVLLQRRHRRRQLLLRLILLLCTRGLLGLLCLPDSLVALLGLEADLLAFLKFSEERVVRLAATFEGALAPHSVRLARQTPRAGDVLIGHDAALLVEVYGCAGCITERKRWDEAIGEERGARETTEEKSETHISLRSGTKATDANAFRHATGMSLALTLEPP